MQTPASTIAPLHGPRLRAALRRSIFLAALTLLAVAPDAAALPPDDSPLPPFMIGLWLDGVGASAHQTATGWRVCWSFSPGQPNGVDYDFSNGILVYFPFVGPLVTLDEEIDLVPEEEPFHKVPDAADPQVSLGTQQAGAAQGHC